MTDTATETLGFALQYEALGYSVIAVHGIRDGKCTCGNEACSSPGKHPIGKWKHRQETRATPDELREQFSRHPYANVGIVTGAISNLAVLDIDHFRGVASVPGLELELNQIRQAKTPIVLTGRATATAGAWHVYLEHPGHHLGNFAKKVPGLDGRADGGFVVAPPSNHVSGRPYKFEAGFDLDTPLLKMPPAVLALFEPKPAANASPGHPPLALAPPDDRYGAAALAGELERVRTAAEGERNNSLNIAALKLGQLIRDGALDRDIVERELHRVALEVGLSEEETRATIASGIAAGLMKPREVPRGRHRNAPGATISVHDPATPWCAYEPLIAAGEDQAPYPIDALPDVLREAVLEYQDYGQQPLPLVACAALANLSLAAQGRGNVARDRNLTGPISLSFMAIADSGERKTAVDTAFGKTIRDYERQKKEEAAPLLKEHAARQCAFEAKMAGYRQKISKCATDGQPTTIYEEAMVALEMERPQPPRVVQLLYEDATIETLLRDIAAGSPSASWWSNEAGMIVGGHSFSEDRAVYTFACINRLWDGIDISSRSRITTGSFEVRGRRLTVSFAFQSSVFQQLLGTGKGASRGTGFLARFLIALPESTMGSRIYKEPSPDLPKMTAYQAMLRAQLEAGLRLKEGSDDDEIDPPLVNMSPAAKSAWVAYHNDIERELRHSGEFEDVKDFASKSADNAVRLATLFHLARGRQPEEPLEAEDVERGCVIARWHLTEARRVLGAQPTQEFQDGQRLLRWIIDRGGRVRAQVVLKDGPSRLRKKGVRDAAMAMLEEQGAARRELEAGTEFFQVHPATPGLLLARAA